jgi:hypothetical protein
MSLIFLGMGFSGELWQERDGGTLRRLLTTREGLPGFLLGKVLGSALVIVLVDDLAANG